MKKIFFVTASLTFSSVMTFAQVFAEKKYEVGNVKEAPKCFGQGVVAFTVGYGYPSWGQVYFNLEAVSYGLDTYDNYTPKGMGPLHFKGEIGLSKFIGMGISVNYETYGGKWTKLYYNGIYAENFTVTSLSVMPRFSVHFATTTQIDPYFGVGAGYKSTTYKFHSDFPNPDLSWYQEGYFPVSIETTVGLRYYFSDAVGIYMEMGLAKSLIQGGLAVKL